MKKRKDAKQARNDGFVMRFDLSLGEIHFDKSRPDGVYATMTDEGFIRGVAHGTRANAVFIYQNEDGEEWGELRTRDEVFHPDSLKSYELAVMTNDHPVDFVSSENAKELAVGSIGTAAKADDFVKFPFVITDKDTIKDVVNGKSELSMGYSALVVPEDGKLDGAAYKFKQTNIRINHCAVVDRGRAGPDCRIPPLQRGDAFLVEEVKVMKTKKIKIGDKEFVVPAHLADGLTKSGDEALAKLAADSLNEESDDKKSDVKIKVKGKEFNVSPELAKALGEGGKDTDDDEAKAEDEEDNEDEKDGKAAKGDAADKGRIAALEAKAKKDADSFETRVDARVQLVADAREILGNDFKTNGVNDLKVMRAVVDEVLPEMGEELDSQPKEDYANFLRGVYRVAVDSHRKATEIADKDTRSIFDAMNDDSEDDDDPDVAYGSYLDSLNGRSKGAASDKE